MIITILVISPLIGVGIGMLLGAVEERCSRYIAQREAERELNELIRGSRK